MNTILDEKWFSRFQSINSIINDEEWLRSFLRVSFEEHEKFLENEVENPEFKYKNTASNTAVRKKYIELKNDIMAHEKNEHVSDLYIAKIDAQISRMKMLDATKSCNDSLFFEESCNVYGRPKKKYFSYVALQMQALCNKAQTPEQLEAAERLRKVFSKIDTHTAVTSADILPAPEVDNEAPLHAKEVKQIFLETLDRYGIPDWKVVIDNTKTRRRFSVMQQKKTIYVPTNKILTERREVLTNIKVEAIAEHEIGVHVRRAFEGAKQPLQLLSVGLHGYLRGEEGLASYVQQQVEGATEYYGFERYLAACLALGMDGVERDFRSVYTLMYDYFTLVTVGGKNLDRRIENATWDVCLRIFRGTTGGATGLIYTRDILYFEGNIGIWKLLIEKPHAFASLFVGKFDPLSKKQVTTLTELKILPEW